MNEFHVLRMMNLNDISPLIVPAKAAVLLVFMPTNRKQQETFTKLINSLHDFLDGSLRILQLDEATHPEVVRSFDITHLPAFVLIRQGVELWRHEGMLYGCALHCPAQIGRCLLTAYEQHTGLYRQES